MSERELIAARINELHAARVKGDLAGMCRTFAEDSTFQIAGASDGKPIAINAKSLREFKPWLAMMIRAFRLSDYELRALIVEGPRAAAHWRVHIHSKITGTSTPTELVDLVEVRGDRIVSYTEFFRPL
jgi:ketosteroid isomerase-like protein